MRALRVMDGRTFLDQAAPEPVPAVSEALIRPTRVGVSETDIVLAGPGSGYSGILGHEFVGVVERIHPDDGKDPAAAGLVGKRVCGTIDAVCRTCDLCRGGLSSHCRARTVLGIHGRDGCFADLFALPIANLTEVPSRVDDDRAAFAEPLSTVLHAAQSVRIEGRPYISIIGDTAVALLAAQVMVHLNASVRVLGTNPARYARCEKWGVKHRHISEVGRRQDQDVVVECTGGAESLALAMRMVRPRGTIVLLGGAVPAPLGSGRATARSTLDLSPIVSEELNIVGSRGGRIPDALTALDRSEVDVVSLITRRMRLEDGPAVLAEAARPDQLKVLIDV